MVLLRVSRQNPAAVVAHSTRVKVSIKPTKRAYQQVCFADPYKNSSSCESESN